VIHKGGMTERVADWPRTQAGVREVAARVLPLLTGLPVERLRSFETFRVIDPVTLEVVLPPTPIQPCEGGGEV
jgi:hypothetical protein